jgi:Asp-tRNA(Asn)/Glu-tRNA(Gln) amidotransferase A subunit family amidase
MPQQSPAETEQQPEPTTTAEAIRHAAEVIGLDFTPEEREQMRALVDARREQLVELREIDLPNDLPVALEFDTRLTDAREIPPAPPGHARPITLSPISEPLKPENPEALAFLPLTHLARLVQTRQVTATELTEHYLERLRTFDPVLKCVVTLTEDLAMAQARRADEEIAAGRYRGPLHGIPWGAKDLIAVPGYPTTWGAEPYKRQVIEATATVARRLEEAGAVLVAKLSSGELAFGDQWFGGRTNNPWNIEEGSSGSSAGPAAAVAAGLVGFGIGTETLGSIISPATRCGVSGLRPTFGRVSRQGVMALCWSLDKIGPMTRSAEDAALVFNAIYGPDGEDGTVVEAPFRWQPDIDITTLRVGYLKPGFEEEYDDRAHDERSLAVLRELGVEMMPVAMPDYEYAPLWIILLCEAAASFDRLTRDNLDDLLAGQEDAGWPNWLRQARLIPAVEYIQANRWRRRVMAEMADIMREVDVVVSPTFRGKALYATNLTGYPAICVPNGFKEDTGTPTSLTFLGGLFKEAAMLALATAYQDVTDFHGRRPPLEKWVTST